MSVWLIAGVGFGAMAALGFRDLYRTHSAAELDTVAAMLYAGALGLAIILLTIAAVLAS